MIAHPPWKTRPDPVRTRPDAHSAVGRPRGDRHQARLGAVLLAALGSLAVAPNDASRAADQEASAPTAAGATTPNAKLATREKPFENTVGMRFVPVPIKGGPTDGKRVLFSIWDTRVQDYAVYAGENEGASGEWKDVEWQGVKQGPTHPVVNVSWEDARAFCAWLTKKEQAAGKIGPREEYRLPTDHEWSCAVGIGEQEEATTIPDGKNMKIKDVYPWGNAWPTPADAGNLDPEMNVDPFPFTSPVGRFAANAFGLFDMAGNVRQWCEDRSSQSTSLRVLRGSTWRDAQARFLLSSYRDTDGLSGRRNYLGFRCVLAERPGAGERKPPVLVIASLPTPGIIAEPPGRSSGYTVMYQADADSEPWRPGGDWVLGKRLGRRIVALKLRTGDLGETLVGKITFAGGEPLAFHGSSLGNFAGTAYKVSTQWSMDSPFTESGTWNIGGRRGERILSLDLVSNDGGETLNGLIEYHREGQFRVKAWHKPGPPGDARVQPSPTLRDGVKVSIVKVVRETYSADVGPVFASTVGVRLDHRVSELAEVKGVRVVLDEVRDSDGTRLKRTKVFAELDRNFRTLRPLFDFDHEGDRYAEATFWLEPGTAQGVAQFSGHVELLIPSRDPASIVTARFSMARDPGVPIGRNPVPGRGNPPGSSNLDPIPGQAASKRQEQLLNEAGVQFLLEQQMDPRKEGGLATPSGGGTMLGWQFTFWGLGFTVRDPHQKVALHVTEFLDPRGRRIESTLAGLGVFKADMFCGFSFFSNPPLGTVAKFYLLTEKSVVPVPFEFKDIVASKQ